MFSYSNFGRFYLICGLVQRSSYWRPPSINLSMLDLEVLVNPTRVSLTYNVCVHVIHILQSLPLSTQSLSRILEGIQSVYLIL